MSKRGQGPKGPEEGDEREEGDSPGDEPEEGDGFEEGDEPEDDIELEQGLPRPARARPPEKRQRRPADSLGSPPVPPQAPLPPLPLTPEERERRLAALKIEINTEFGRYKRYAERTYACLLVVGIRLHEAKHIVGHGNFGTWLKESNCPFTHRTANVYMDISAEKLKFARAANLAEKGLLDRIEEHNRKKAAAVEGVKHFAPKGLKITVSLYQLAPAR